MSSSSTDAPSTSLDRPRHRYVSLVALLALIATMLVAMEAIGSDSAEASHFRSTQLTWEVTEVDPDGPVTVEFTSTVGARQGFGPFGDPDVGDIIQPGSSFVMGDGQSVSNVDHEVLVHDVANDWILAEGTFTHTYQERGEYTAHWEQCCRLQLSNGHVNNSNLRNRIETFLDLSGDPGDPVPTTSSPVSLISPIVDCPVDDVCNFSVPAVDADGASLAWRFAEGSESTRASDAGDWDQPGPPHADNAATVGSAGAYSWDTTGAQLAAEGTPTYYSTSVVIEKRVGGDLVATTGVDFFIRLGDPDGNQAPVFIDPTPADGTVFRVVPGTEVVIAVAAEDPDVDDTVTLGVLGAPPGSTFDSAADNPAAGTFTWTPEDPGSRLVTFVAQDDLGLGAVPRSVTIVAEEVVELTLAPETASLQVDETHTITATASNAAGDPIAQAQVTFDIVSGPHETTSHTATTDQDGNATFSYEGQSVGTDTIAATYSPAEGDTVTSNEVNVEWSEVLADVDEAEEDEEVEELEDEAEPATPVEAEPDFTG